MNDSLDGDLFRIERLITKLWKMHVSVQRRADAAYFHLNRSWCLKLDEDDVRKLARQLSSEHAFLEELDNMLDRCMSLLEVRQEYRANR